MGKLKIIKASAGSGKTHRLTQEYIELLYRQDRAYRNILAVTFTNKATEEMKHRVLEELFADSSSNPNARKVLIEILHDYSSFSISTIDRFFQQALRAFAREIGRNGSYGIELDVNLVAEEAVDNMMLDLDKNENRTLLEWLTAFSIDSIENGEGWNLKKRILVLAGELFKESYRLKNESMLDAKGFLSSYRRSLKDVVDTYEKEFISIGKEAVGIINAHSLVLDDFKYGRNGGTKFFFDAAGGVVKYPSVRFFTLPDQPENWLSVSGKGNPSVVEAMESAYMSGLNNMALALSELSKGYIRYNSARIILKNIYTLGILIDIEQYVKRYTKERNIVLIPETTELLNRIICGSDTPFIYEKIGTRIEHFMLDEFQDTSLMQWQNFRPLIENSLSSGNSNLLVGDVKQSIYRWRGSDWNLLNSGIYEDLSVYQMENEILGHNWRSSKNIVDFNNIFFPYAAKSIDRLLDDIEKEHNPHINQTFSAESIYAGSDQQLPSGKEAGEGHVMLKFIRDEKEMKSWKMLALEEIPSIVSSLNEHRYAYRDIAFLVRTNSEGVSVVNYLIEKGYPVISDEALLISSSAPVRRAVTILKYLNDPADSINNTIAEFEGVIGNEFLHSLIHLPLYELCEKIVMDPNEENDQSDSLFIQTFLDLVLEYTRRNRSDISSFLEWWEEKGCKNSVPAPEGQNAMRVMTIHKAKGLGIAAVIIPFFDIPLDHLPISAPVLWTKPSGKPFDEIPLLPVKYGRELEESIFRDDYFSEKQRTYIDNLNIAYVAFTRAKKELIILSGIPAKKSMAASLSSILYDKFSEMEDEMQSVHFGSWSMASENSAGNHAERQLPPLVSYDITERLKLRLKGEAFFDPESRRNYGLIMHAILSRVEREEDLPGSLAVSVAEGELSYQQYNAVLEKLSGFLAEIRGRHWFDGTMQVYNELEIIEPGGSISRPDRVLLKGLSEAIVIDFKFGGKMEHSHIRQVEKYLSLIREMGISGTQGYVWYPEHGKVAEVN